MNNTKKRIILIILFVVTLFISVCFGTLMTTNSNDIISVANNHIHQMIDGGMNYE